MLDAEVARVRNASAATPQHLFDGRDRATQHNREIRIKGTIKLSINSTVSGRSPEEILTCIATDAIDATDGSQGGKLSYIKSDVAVAARLYNL
ncbi:hypothetical protein E4U34_005479 [Claviceps purpurea]|nr:hypothetical protein E4U34_005479 [Claviceps purpurea]KAG6271446.1 hypothetical protein E4U47_003060 [Claviceps purpurea]KAG6317136.1 hypothetical protein E4U44_000276 [Claviceps purpurea]